MANQLPLIEARDGSGNYLFQNRVLGASDTLEVPGAADVAGLLTLDAGASLAAGNITADGAMSVVTLAGDLSLAPANDLHIDLADAAGARAVSFRDSGDAEVANINSDGDATFGGDVVINGSLTVNGAPTIIEGTTVSYEDSLLLLAKDVTGSPSLDVGFVGERGDSDNVAFVWDESADRFVLVTTDSDGSGSSVNILDYADLRVGALVADDSLSIAGTSVTAILDEDNMASDSASALATQQSIKAYVDAQIGAGTFSALADTNISSLSSGHIAVYDGVDSWDNKAISGDATLAASGALTLAATITSVSSLANLVEVGALNSGSITSGFGAIDIGSSALDAGAATLASLTLASGATVTAVLDEDTMSSDSATAVPTQQSVKAYVDAATAAQDAFSELTDTNIAAPAGGHVAIYDGVDSWDNKALSGDATLAASGALTLAASNTNLTNLANVVEVGALAAGSIAVGFGAIDIGSQSLTAGGTTLGALTLSSGVQVTAILDEDALSSDSASAVPTQQSVKAYVDAQVAAPTVADGSEILWAGYDQAASSPAVANTLAVLVGETGAMKVRLPDPSSGGSYALNRIAGVYRAGDKLCKNGRCSAVLVEDNVSISIGDELVASVNTPGRVTIAGGTGAPVSGEFLVSVGMAESAVAGGVDQTVAASLSPVRPIQL